MAMFKWASTARSQTGDSLAGWQVECVQLSDNQTVVPIFADENGTAISSVSGISNRALTDSIGNYEFFVENGIYTLRFYDENGEFRRLERYFTMYGAPDPIPINAQTGTTYTLALTDAYGAVSLSNASAITLTVPPESSVAFDTGTFIEFHQAGAGAVTVAAGSGVTVNSRSSRTATTGQYAAAGLRKTGSDEWLLLGDLA